MMEKLTASAWAQTRADFGLAGAPKAVVNDIMAVTETAAHLIEGFSGRTRAFVQVQNGCDHRCSFCIIPYGRGNSRSVSMGAVVADVQRLVANGYCEVVLTGVDITSYGADLPGAPKFGALVKQVLKHVPELRRLRLSSIDSVEADRDLIDAFAQDERLMPHLHLSLQAGDDLILKRMKRRHSRQDAIAFCDALRRLRPDMIFGADIIAGFPTETEDMFANSLALVEDCGLTHLHVFPFSARPGTPAARMPQLPREIVKERARRLRQQGALALQRHLDAEVGAIPACVDRAARARSHRAVHAGIARDARGAGRHPRCSDRRARRQAIAGGLARLYSAACVFSSASHPHAAKAARICCGTGAVTRIGGRFFESGTTISRACRCRTGPPLRGALP